MREGESGTNISPSSSSKLFIIVCRLLFLLLDPFFFLLAWFHIFLLCDCICRNLCSRWDVGHSTLFGFVVCVISMWFFVFDSWEIYLKLFMKVQGAPLLAWEFPLVRLFDCLLVLRKNPSYLDFCTESIMISMGFQLWGTFIYRGSRNKHQVNPDWNGKRHLSTAWTRRREKISRILLLFSNVANDMINPSWYTT